MTSDKKYQYLMPEEEVKRMNISEFRELGYLQEVNRKFFHPLGLALEVRFEDDGSEHLSGIWDYRDDPDGLLFSSVNSNEVIGLVKVAHVEAQYNKMKKTREKKYGWMIQPVNGE